MASDLVSAAADWPPGQLARLGRMTWRVADVLRRHGPSTRAEIVSATGLSRPTVSNVVKELVDLGWAESGVVPDATGGRPAAVFRLSRMAGLAMGVDIGRRHIRVVIVDAGHGVLARDDRPLAEDADDNPDLVLRLAATLARELLGSIGGRTTELIGVGLAIPAPMTLEGRIGSLDWLPKWADMAPGDRFAKLLDDVPVKAHNDASLGGLGEHVFGNHSASRNLVYVKAATGIGSGFVIDGQMYEGAAGTAGEIGHVTLDHRGPQCRCGNSGCLELYAGGEVILKRASDAGYYPTDLSALVADAVAANHLAQNLVREAGEHIGVALGAVVNSYGPDRILIGGELSAAGDIVLGPIRSGMRRAAMPVAFGAVQLELAKLRSMSTAMGGAAVVLRSGIATPSTI